MHTYFIARDWPVGLGSSNHGPIRLKYASESVMTKLGMVELRLNLCSRARNTTFASRAREQEEMGGDFDPRLSTAFAKGGGLLPTAANGSSQR